MLSHRLRTVGVATADASRRVSRSLMDLVYPNACVGCGTSLRPDAPSELCRRCAAEIQYIGDDRCPRCGMALGPHTGESRDACPSCRPSLHFKQAVGVWRYEGVGREVIHRWKYQGGLAAQKLLVRRLLTRLEGEAFTETIDVVCPVPMHWRRRLIRRFNQAELLARDVAGALGIPCRRLLARTRNTPSQVTLGRRDRIENVRGAFRLARRASLSGSIVLLVDDVVTTCATAAESARALRHGGARAVYVACVAR